MSDPEKVGVRMPTLYVIPIGTKPAVCGCGAYQYFVRDGDVTRTISISGKFYSKTAAAEITVPGCKAPTPTQPGLGFDHHIDCPQREQHRTRKKSERERKRDVGSAEALAAKHGIKCSGSVGVNDCNGFGVIAFLLGKRLFATPCSAHADRVERAIRDAGRGRDCELHALEEFLVDRGPDVAKQFAERAARVRAWHIERGGVIVPRTGHL